MRRKCTILVCPTGIAQALACVALAMARAITRADRLRAIAARIPRIALAPGVRTPTVTRATRGAERLRAITAGPAGVADARPAIRSVGAAHVAAVIMTAEAAALATAVPRSALASPLCGIERNGAVDRLEAMVADASDLLVLAHLAPPVP